MAKAVLCFGDSNTYGYAPYDGRFGAETRWPGRLATALGPGWQVREAGLNGRTIGHYDPLWPEKNSVDVLAAYLEREAPLEVLILLLGSNDALFAPVANIADDMERLLDIVEDKPALRPRRVLVLGSVPLATEDPAQGITAGMNRRFRQIAENRGMEFADAASWNIDLGEDGCHFSPLGHQRFAEKTACLLLDEK